MLDVRKLRLLRELARRGTIAAVAEALAYTASAVSQQLSALEREAGVALLARSGRGVVLTPAGLVLVEHAEDVLAVLERASAAVAEAGGGLAGPLRIGAFPTAARTILPAALVELARRHPGLELRVDEVDPAEVPDAVRGGELDVALVHDYDFVPQQRDPGLDSEPLLTEAMFLASARPPEVGVDPIGWCRDLPWILGRPDTLCHLVAVRACQVAGFTPRVRHHADDFGTVLALVAAGLGVAMVPELGVGDPPEGVVLTRLPVHRRTQAAYRAGAGGHPAVAACVAALRSSVAARQSSHASPSARSR
ncbi:LysR family transcriptional regulator [Solihabitans fulvus]|uniref:LysR family transcriptional regulator n=1 Tax=Solihabitans fulvus TaxID=1892852 RepID=A0A5B2WT11_9PSEU|nr:LysR substrate-binding domain-containing protein [Solihabitans fulvus]KAA2253852.1 LysR family transcriptional regulator [Solihabitans fulvus]